MNESPNDRLRRLLSLLDDDQDRNVSAVMAELLKNEAELPALLAEMQESDDPCLRRRSHQLQAILLLRRRRRNFSRLLTAPTVDYQAMLIELHLLWFDNDSRPVLARALQELVKSSRERGVENLFQLAGFMRNAGLVAEADSTVVPENYCLGTVLRDGRGAASLLTLLAWTLLPRGQRFHPARVLGDFAIIDVKTGELLIPGHFWQLESAPKSGVVLFPPVRLLAFAALNLFSSAVNSDSYRYIWTLFQAITGSENASDLAVLPYPYGGKDDNR